MGPALLLVALLQGTVPPDPVALVREIQRTIDRDRGGALETRWRAALARRPTDPAAVLAVATFERTRYRYEKADSLYGVLLGPLGDAGVSWTASARLGMGLWRALGSDPARADTLFVSVREDARRAGHALLEADAILGLSQLRGRTQGPKVARQLIGEWWALLPRPSPADSALYLCQRGALDEQLGDTTGLRQVIRGAELATRHASWRTAGSCRLLIAQSAERRGFREMARKEARQGLADHERIGYDVGIALGSQWFGYLEVQRVRYASGRALLERAIQAARRTRFESVEAWARSGLAEYHLSVGDPAAARAQAMAAAASHRRRGDRWGMATALGQEASALESAGELEDARARLSDAIAAFAAAGLPYNSLPARTSKARMEMRLGMLDSAERTITMAADVGRSSEGWQNEQRVLRAELALRRGRFDDADTLIRAVPGSVTWRTGDRRLPPTMIALREAQIALHAGRLARADTALNAVTAALEAWRDFAINASFTGALAQLRENWGRLSDLYPDVIAQLVQRGRLQRAFDFVETVRARDIVERRLQSAASIEDSVAATRVLAGRGGRPVVTVEGLQRSLAYNEAFVSIMLGLEHDPSTALVVTRDSAVSVSLPGRAALVADIERLVQLASVGTEALAPSRRLGASVLAPLLAVLPPSVQRVMVSPDLDLYRIPWDALRLPDGRFAIERAAWSVMPSATTLLTLRALAGEGGSDVLAFGDPNFRPRAAGGAPRETDAREPGFGGVDLQRLRHSGVEASRVARYGVRSRVLLGREASESALRRVDWRRVGVAHFATHAIVDPESQARTALVLTADAGTDGFLTPAELATLSLRSPLVVLSACHSLGGQVLGGEGLRGLAAPLLEAGARAIVATHWSIGDRSVVPFIDRFYASMAVGASVDDALRQTKLAAIREGVSIGDWGSFTVIGDGSMRPTLRRPGLAPVPWVREAGQ